jgi:hypothetical protein
VPVALWKALSYLQVLLRKPRKVLCVWKVKDEYIYWRINEQNLCIAVIHLYNEKGSVVPHHPVLSERQRTELTSRNNME